MSALQIQERNPADLRASASNARTHTDKQVRQIAQSIRAFGFNNPVLIDRNDEIVAGHGRVTAALELGLPTVPTIRLEHLTPAQKRAYIIADNKLAELAGWDRDTLAIELQGLVALDLDFEITALGFEMPEIDLMISEIGAPVDAAVDKQMALDRVPAVAREGDLWLLEDHALFCGDALDRRSYDILLGRERAEMVFTDPPYNVPIPGHVSGKGKAHHQSFVMASGEMSEDEFVRFLRIACEQMIEVSADGALHFICMDWRHLRELLEAGKPIYSDLKNLAVWVKTNGGMGSLYRSQHELTSTTSTQRSRRFARAWLTVSWIGRRRHHPRRRPIGARFRSAKRSGLRSKACFSG